MTPYFSYPLFHLISPVAPGEACAKTGWRVHTWCVMSNHYHLAVETPQANLVEGMRWLQ